MQTTKPNIPTKNKNSADPDIRKFRDSEVNAIVSGFQQVDDNFDVVETELVNIAEPDLDQFIEVGGRYRISKLHVTPPSSIVDFTTWGKKGATNLPVYDTFSFNEASIIEANADQLKTWVIIGSFNANPNILIPNKPTSPVPVYDGLTNPTSLLPVYGSQALMTADFANQTINEYYYFTGSNTAWKYDGTATDSIANYTPELYMLGDQSSQVTDSYYEYTGSTSMWRKTAASTGAIGDYTELVEVLGWAESGTKPAFLNITGTILTGYANLNRLVFELVMIDAIPKVNLVITQWAGANTDPFKGLVLNLNFEEGIGDEAEFIDSSIFGNNGYTVLGTSIDPSGTPAGRVASTDGNAVQWLSDSTGSSAILGLIPASNNLFINDQVFSFMCSLKLSANSTNQTVGIMSKNVSSAFTGIFLRKVGIVTGNDNKFEMRINNATNLGRRLYSTYVYDTPDTQIHIACVWNAGWKFYVNGVLDSSTEFTGLPENNLIDDITKGLYIGYRQEASTTNVSPRNGTEIDNFKFFRVALTDAQILAEATNLGLI